MSGERTALDHAALLRHRGEWVKAEELLRATLAASTRSTAIFAALILARFLEDQQRSDEADLLYERAAGLASGADCPEALIDLAAHWKAGGDAARAAETYERVADLATQASVRAVACFRLADIQRDAGMLEQAALNWRRVLVEGSATLVAHARVSLAETLLEMEGEDEHAEALLREALASDHPDLGPRAALTLAQLLRARGRVLDAHSLYQVVVDSEHPGFVSRALAEQDDLIEDELDSFLSLPAVTGHRPLLARVVREAAAEADSDTRCELDRFILGERDRLNPSDPDEPHSLAVIASWLLIINELDPDFRCAIGEANFFLIDDVEILESKSHAKGLFHALDYLCDTPERDELAQSTTSAWLYDVQTSPITKAFTCKLTTSKRLCIEAERPLTREMLTLSRFGRTGGDRSRSALFLSHVSALGLIYDRLLGPRAASESWLGVAAVPEKAGFEGW